MDDIADDIRVVLITVPDTACARNLANALLEQRMAACVNIVPAVESHYRWQGKIEQSSEVLLIVKTAKTAIGGLERIVREEHPYECPEILAMPILSGSPAYLSWLRESVGP